MVNISCENPALNIPVKKNGKMYSVIFFINIDKFLGKEAF